MSNYTYRIGTGLAVSKTKDVELFEHMAQKGYKPVKLNIFGFYKFKKCEPEEVSYAADCVDIKQGTSEFEDYKQIFKEGGWEFVYGQCGCNFFKASKGTTPLYTDGYSESIMYREMAKKLLPIVAVLVSLLLILIVVILLFARESNYAFMWTMAGIMAACDAVLIFFMARCYYRARRVIHV